MKLINEDKKVGKTVYSRTLGCTLTMQEMLEDLEYTNHELGSNEDMYTIPSSVEYEILVNGKSVNAEDITINLYDSEDELSNEFYNEASGDYLSVDDFRYVEELATLDKAELIERLLQDRKDSY